MCVVPASVPNLPFLPNQPVGFADDRRRGRKCFVDKCDLLIMMHLVRSGCWTCGSRTAHITQLPLRWDRVIGIDDGLHLLFDEVPGSHVLGFLLHPEQLGTVGVTAQNVG